jgi:prepilin-type N-terminal cleavage/methylation domain-containing protein
MSLHRSRSAQANSGYTLVELLVSVVILSIALLATLSAIRVAQDTQDRANHIAIARDIAISNLERYRWLKWNHMGDIPASQTSSDLPSGNAITCSAAQYPNGSSGVYKATVQVSWPEGNGTRTVKYESLFWKW